MNDASNQSDGVVSPQASADETSHVRCNPLIGAGNRGPRLNLLKAQMAALRKSRSIPVASSSSANEMRARDMACSIAEKGGQTTNGGLGFPRSETNDEILGQGVQLERCLRGGDGNIKAV